MSKTLSWNEVVALWDRFDKKMEKKGYQLIVNCGMPGLTDSTKAIKDDRYVPVISFLVFQIKSKEYIFSIKVEDRNGDAIVGGKGIGYFRFSEYTEEKLDEAIKYILDTFGQYNEDNTVPTKFEEIERTF